MGGELKRECFNLCLRNVTREDLDVLRQHRNNLSTRNWLREQRIISVQDQEVWFNGGGAEGFKIIVCDGLDIGIGRISKSTEPGFTSVGLDLFEEFRGLGLGYNAFVNIVASATERRNPLDLWVFIENTRATRIYDKAGFKIDESYPAEVYPRSILGEIKFFRYVRYVLVR